MVSWVSSTKLVPKYAAVPLPRTEMNLDEALQFCAFPTFISLRIEMNGVGNEAGVVPIDISVVIAVVSLRHLLSHVHSADDTG